jgi:hypothetical protein
VYWPFLLPSTGQAVKPKSLISYPCLIYILLLGAGAPQNKRTEKWIKLTIRSAKLFIGISRERESIAAGGFVISSLFGFCDGCGSVVARWSLSCRGGGGGVRVIVYIFRAMPCPSFECGWYAYTSCCYCEDQWEDEGWEIHFDISLAERGGANWGRRVKDWGKGSEFIIHRK